MKACHQLAIFLVVTSASSVFASGWWPTGSIPVGGDYTLRQDALVVLADGSVFVVTYPNPLLRDPNTGTWYNVPHSSSESNAFLLQDGRVLVVPMALVNLEIYDPNMETWTIPAQPYLRDYAARATVLLDGTVLLSGRYNSLYDPVGDTWTPISPMNFARYAYTATLLQDGRVLVAGGSSPDYREVAEAEIYDPSTGNWTVAANMIFPRNSHTATLLYDGRVLVTGGQVVSEVYDPSTDNWTRTADMSRGRFGHTATLLQDGTVLVAGHYDGGIPPASTERFYPSTGTWVLQGDMTTGRGEHLAALLNDGRVFVAAGVSGYRCDEFRCWDVTTNTCEIFTP